MKKVLGHRLLLVGVYLFIGILLSAVGRSQEGTKAMNKPGKTTLKQEIISAFRNLMAQDVSRLVFSN
ncbi:hypothetical protein ACFPMF_02670 [Larkinella bovis]|uniref:Uncharacterized protein n=1 Tax=Larkinella bovis TaxID=683041 RepID=A0ABW0I6N3_9BACT